MKRTELKRKTPLKSRSQLHRKTSLKAGKKRSNPRPTMEDYCCICGQSGAHTHEVFHGIANREVSRQHGFQVRLCESHHQGTDGVHGRDGRDLDLYLKREAQAAFEVTHTRDEFINLIGKSYLS